MNKPLLRVEDLRVSFRTEDGVVRAVDRLSFEVERGEVVAIVGGPRSGKTVAALTLIGLVGGPGVRISGRASLGGVDLLGASSAELARIRGHELVVAVQDPGGSLNPVRRIGDQVVEQIVTHRLEIDRRPGTEQAVEVLARSGVNDARELLGCYPHEVAEAVRRRVAIAVAMCGMPKVLIVDDPMCSPDMTLRAQVLHRVRELREQAETGVVLLARDLTTVAGVADRVLVIHQGRVIEQGPLDQVLRDPQHPYTWLLVAARTASRAGGSTRLARTPRGANKLRPAGPRMTSLSGPDEGCHLRQRCPHAFSQCLERPELMARTIGSPEHLDSCWLAADQKRTVRGFSAYPELLSPRS